MYVGLPTRGVHGKHCDILFVHRLKVPGVNGHHLDGAPSLGRHKDFSRYPVISREGKTLDYLFVCDELDNLQVAAYDPHPSNGKVDEM